MTQQLLPILSSIIATILIVIAIALCRSASGADAISEDQEKAASHRVRSNNYDEELSSASVRRQSPQPSANERLASTAARADTREPVRPASLSGRTGRVSISYETCKP
jgi:hypothetical protein